MEIIDADALEVEAERRNALQKKWAFWARFVHDTTLPLGRWAVDGVLREEELTEENLKRAVMREGAAKPVVSVSAPLHTKISQWIGWEPPFRTDICLSCSRPVGEDGKCPECKPHEGTGL